MKPELKPEEIRAWRNRIVHGTFVREGGLVAFPLCFPGVTMPIPPDESSIGALDVTADGIVYGATNGRAVHLFVAMMQGATGAVVDLGVLEGATAVSGIVCAGQHVVVAVASAEGGRLVTRPFQGLPFDLLQEWSFPPREITVSDPVSHGEPVFGLARNASHDVLVGTTPRCLFVFDPGSGDGPVKRELEVSGAPVCVNGRFYGPSPDGTIWEYDSARDHLTPGAFRLPDGNWLDGAPVWSAGEGGQGRHVADASGGLWQFLPSSGAGKAFAPRGSVPLTPVRALAETRDGRLYGFMGEGIARLFVLEPGAEPRDLGAAISVFERRRYGFSFGSAVTGPDGRLYFGEDDQLGHLWIYFPALPAPATPLPPVQQRATPA